MGCKLQQTPGPPDPLPPDRADLSVPAPRPRAVMKAVVVMAAALTAAVVTHQIMPRAPATPLQTDVWQAGAGGLRGGPATFQPRP